jgi:hypothetical protein
MHIQAPSCLSRYKKKLNSVAFSPQANYTDRAMPLVGEVSAK